MENIRLAETGDIDEIAALFKNCTDAMIEVGIDQWDYTYPLKKHILADVLAKEAYIFLEHGKIAATITLNDDQALSYNNVHWKYSGKIMVIHRLAVNPAFQGKGYGKKTCLLAEKQAKAGNYDSIRLDAYSKNKVSLSLYEKLGYEKAYGYCYFHKNPTPFYLYEKQILK